MMLFHPHKKKLSPIAVSLVLALAPAAVYAECGDNNDPAITSAISCTPATGDAMVNADGISVTVSSANTGVNAVSLDGNTVVNMVDTLIDLSPAIARHGINAQVMGGEGSVSVSLSGDNVIKLDAASDTALLAGTAGSGSHAIYLRDISNGNATITNDGSIRHD